MTDHDDTVDRYLAYLAERDRSANTVDAYRGDLARLVTYLGAGIDWSQLRRGHLLAFLRAEADRGMTRSTLARKTASLKSFCRWLAATGGVDTDPSARLDTPQHNRVMPSTLEPPAIEALLAAPTRNTPEGVRDRALLRVLAVSGVRITELIDLDLEDLDLASGYARVRGRREPRYVPLDAATVAALQAYLTDARPRQVRTRDPAPALFVNHRGARLTRQGVWLRLRGYAAAAGLPDAISPHTLRHSCAVNLLRDHATVRDVQELLGHANVYTTQFYDRLVRRGRVA